VDAACIVSYEETAAGDAFYAFHHDDPSCPETRDLLFSSLNSRIPSRTWSSSPWSTRTTISRK
jgi:hypothetical protein